LADVSTGEEHNRRWAVYEMPGYADGARKGKKKGGKKNRQQMQ
jgi:hypothetical protein